MAKPLSHCQRMETVPLKVHAPAKINLGLEILRRRADGFHDLNTLFATVGVEDTLLFHPRKDGRIECRVEGNPLLAAEPDNLVVRAAHLLRERYGSPELGVQIELRKEIPTGAGLGGGSSDAAATLLGLRTLWHLSVSERDLLDLAESLGSDVPFFIHGGLALGRGRGEILEPLALDLPEWWAVLVNPGVHIPTPWAFRALDRHEERTASDLHAAVVEGINDPSTLRKRLTNDFEEPVFAAHPALAVIRDQLYRAGAFFALMSGSGSTLFGLFEDRSTAERAAADFSEGWCRVAQVLPDHQHSK